MTKEQQQQIYDTIFDKDRDDQIEWTLRYMTKLKITIREMEMLIPMVYLYNTTKISERNPWGPKLKIEDPVALLNDILNVYHDVDYTLKLLCTHPTVKEFIDGALIKQATELMFKATCIYAEYYECIRYQHKQMKEAEEGN